MPGKFIVDVTYFVNFVTRDQYSVNLDMMDPAAQLHLQVSALTPTVNNPVLQLRNTGDFPGRVPAQHQDRRVGSLLVPYPQYSGITQTGTDLRSARYQSLQLRGQRAFAHGFSFLATYARVWTRSQWFFDPQDEYD